MSRMRPSWVDYYLGLATVVAQRSHDSETRHGCVITDASNRVLSLGYNGLPRGANDLKLPTTRPEKYPWMFHAEQNALANCVLRPYNAKAYVSGRCCNDCIYALWQHGITTVYMLDRHGTFAITDADKQWFKRFQEEVDMEIYVVMSELEWLNDLPKSLPNSN